MAYHKFTSMFYRSNRLFQLVIRPTKQLIDGWESQIIMRYLLEDLFPCLTYQGCEEKTYSFDVIQLLPTIF